MRSGPLFSDLLALLDTPEPAGLGPERRPDALSIQSLDEKLRAPFQDQRLTPATKNLLRATIYLWHDHLDPAHEIAQAIENQDGSLVHAIMHRREPDYGNAKYWFRRVGTHPSFLGLALKAGEYLAKNEQGGLLSRLLPNKTWDPFAFVDAVEDTAEGQFIATIPILRQVQKLEFESLVENLVNRIS